MENVEGKKKEGTLIIGGRGEEVGKKETLILVASAAKPVAADKSPRSPTAEQSSKSFVSILERDLVSLVLVVKLEEEIFGLQLLGFVSGLVQRQEQEVEEEESEVIVGLLLVYFGGEVPFRKEKRGNKKE